MPIIFDLCGGTGSWSEPYRRREYTVYVIDPETPIAAPFGVRATVEAFAAQMRDLFRGVLIAGILAAPPCTEFAGSGRQHWSRKGGRELLDATETVRACLAIVDYFSPAWWVLENPVGRLQELVPDVGEVRLTFNPSDYGDPYTKRTQLYGQFILPVKRPVRPILGSMMHHLGETKDRARLRSITPPGFAEAFCVANP